LIEVFQILLTDIHNYPFDLSGIMNAETHSGLCNIQLENFINNNNVTVEVIPAILKQIEDHSSLSKTPTESPSGLSLFQCVKVLNLVYLLVNLNKEIPTQIYTKIYLENEGKYSPHWVFISEIQTPMTLVVILKNAAGSSEEKDLLLKSKQNIGNSLKLSYMDFLLTVENTFSMITYVHLIPGLVHYIIVDRTNNTVHAPAITSLFGPYSVHKKK